MAASGREGREGLRKCGNDEEFIAGISLLLYTLSISHVSCTCDLTVYSSPLPTCVPPLGGLSVVASVTAVAGGC